MYPIEQEPGTWFAIYLISEYGDNTERLLANVSMRHSVHSTRALARNTTRLVEEAAIAHLAHRHESWTTQAALGGFFARDNGRHNPEIKGKEATMFTNEKWEELHLIPEGWKGSSYRHVPGDPVMIEPPANDMLTVRKHMAAVHGGPSRVTEDRTPRADDVGQIEQLLLKYGVPVFSVQSKDDAAERIAAQHLGVSLSARVIFNPRNLREELA